MSYKKLEIWSLARELVIDIHRMSLDLPDFEQYETGRQIRRSSKSVKSCIVEGYGRRVYKSDFLRFLIYAQSSNDETYDHLETLYETGSLTNEKLFGDLINRTELLGKKLNRFIQGVNREHNILEEEQAQYILSQNDSVSSTIDSEENIPDQGSSIQHQESVKKSDLDNDMKIR